MPDERYLGASSPYRAAAMRAGTIGCVCLCYEAHGSQSAGKPCGVLTRHNSSLT